MTPQALQAPLARRLLFLLGNLIGGLAIAFACIIPMRDLLTGRDEEIQHKRTALARMRAVAAREPEVASKAAPLAEGEFLAGKTDGVIGAGLQARLKGMAEAAGAKVRSIRGLQPKVDGQTRFVGSHIEVVGSIAAIHRAIHAVETAKPYLFVTGGTIRLTQPVGQAGRQEPQIEAQLDVFGVVRIGAPER